MPHDLLPSGRADEPIEGWRIWNLADELSAPRLLPAGSGGDVWEPMRAVQAVCTVPSIVRLGSRRHRAPGPACSCGIHAGMSLAGFPRPRPAWPPPTIVGTVSLWGTVVEHEQGWRAEHAYPSRLAVVCAMCAWFEPGSGVAMAIHVFGGCAYALCSEHRGGIQLQDGRRTHPTDADPVRVQAALLNAYAVDPLPLSAADVLFAQPPTPEPDSYVPSIRVVPVEEEGRRAPSLGVRRRRER
ncbi:MAG: hypothetical protein ACM3OO_10160 [Planctomycetaceae bacterium]